MMMQNVPVSDSLLIFDRDGVLNAMCIHQEHGTIDSPLNEYEVSIVPGVPEALATCTRLGYKIAIATNQPAAAKGKTTRANLERVHACILSRLTSCGAKIASSEICWHTQEDRCTCRKPQATMLLKALTMHEAHPAHSWMIGDGITDMQAGLAAGVRLAFLGPKKCDSCKVHERLGIWPHYWGKDVPSFVEALEKSL